MMKNYLLLLAGCLCWNAEILRAQDLSTLPKAKDAFQINGSVDLTFGFYDAFGDIDPRRDRYQYLVSGNLNPRFYGIDMPLNAVYSQQETTFLQPFNRFGLSPRYKDITGHFGFRTLTYSPLTLNGHLFLGAGVDYTVRPKTGPVNYVIRAMYGRLRRPVEPLEAQQEGFLPSYRRMGYSVSAGVVSRKNSANYLNMVLLRGEDRIGSIEAPLLSQNVKPEDNLVVGLNGQVQLLKSITFKFDAAQSALTRDQRDESVESTKTIVDLFDGLYTPTVSTQVKDALKTETRYSNDKFYVGVNYNRIDPDYRTHGSYFFQNDIEEATLNAGTRLFAGKVQVSGSIGGQRNNLEDQQSTAQRRFIGSFNWNHTVNSRFNYNLSYSNFSSSLLVQQDVLTDSLNLYQISTNYTGGANYSFGSEEGKQRIGLVLSHQIGNSRDEYFISENITKFYNAGLSYLIGFPKLEASAQFGFNYTLNDTDLFESTNVGPSLGLSKKFFDKKITARYVLSYLSNTQNGENLFGVVTNRFNLNYKFHPKHTVRLGFGTLSKNDKQSSVNSYSEFRATVGYRLRF